jgi:hypothetical protein
MKQSILNRMRIFTALAGVVLAFAGFVTPGPSARSARRRRRRLKRVPLRSRSPATWEVSDSNRESMR